MILLKCGCKQKYLTSMPSSKWAHRNVWNKSLNFFSQVRNKTLMQTPLIIAFRQQRAISLKACRADAYWLIVDGRAIAGSKVRAQRAVSHEQWALADDLRLTIGIVRQN